MRIRAEIDDGLTFLGSWVLSVLTWIIFFGWNPDLMVSNHDAVYLDIPILSELFHAQGDWSQILYRANWLGGMKIFPATGMPWFLALWIRAGFSPPTVINLWVFLNQSIYSYLAIKSVSSLLYLWRKGGVPKVDGSPSFSIIPWVTRIPLIWVFAFVPVLGWRYFYGHNSVALASQLFISVFACLVAHLAQTQTLFLTFFAILVSFSCFHSSMQQPILYGVIFGAPILLGALWSALSLQNATFSWRVQIKRGLKIILFAAGPALIGLLLALPAFSILIMQAVSSDSARSLTSEPVVYSYLTGRLWDWVASLLWSFDLVGSPHPPGMHHEINYPMGPLLLAFIFLFPWQEFKKLGWGLLICVFLVIGLSDHLPGISQLLLAVFRPLQQFRVPTRAALVFALIFPILGIASLLRPFFSYPLAGNSKKTSPMTPERKVFYLLLTIGLCGVLVWVPKALRETLLWALLLIFCLRVRFNLWPSLWPDSRLLMPATSLIAILGLGSLLAFQERALPFFQSSPVRSEMEQIRGAILAQVPELTSPLSRASLDFQVPSFGANAGAVMGISSLSGYGFPQRRFVQLIQALSHRPYDPSLTYLPISTKFPVYRPLAALYNVRTGIDLDSSRRIQINPVSASNSPAWFVSSMETVDHFETLVDRFHQWAGGQDSPLLADLESQVHSTGLVVKDDSAFTPAFTAELAQKDWRGCKDSRVEKIQPDEWGQSVRMNVKTSGDCPLIVSINYDQNLQATSLTEPGKGVPLKVFPIFGSLTGVIVPQGTSDVDLKFDVQIPYWARAGQVLGFALLLLGAFFFYRSQKIASVVERFN